MKRMHTLAGICALAWAAPGMAQHASLPANVEAAIRQRVDVGANPSMVVAIVDGAESRVYSFGKVASGRPPTDATLYEIGSITKTFTATLLADAVTRGTLKLDQPIADLMPGVDVPSFKGQPITLLDIAEQHSGLPRLPNNLDPSDSADPYADYDADRLKRFLATYQLPGAPGERYEYSNLAVGMLGYALAQSAHTDYTSLVTSRVFAPLGMQHSYVALRKEDPPGMAGGHDFAGHPTRSWYLNVLAGAGAIRSTGADMLRYLRANMGLLPSPLGGAMRLAQAPRVDTANPGNRIGLVWMTRHASQGPDITWHNGLTAGYASFIGFTADRRHGVVILSNSAVDVNDLGFAALGGPDVPAPAYKRVTLSPEALAAYPGAYQLNPHMIVHVVSADGHLVAQATGQQAIPLFPTDNGTFYAQVGDISVTFHSDASGKVSGLVLHQHGDHDAPRISESQAATAEGVQAVSLDAATLQGYVGRYDFGKPGVLTVRTDGKQLTAQLGGQSALTIYASERDHFFYNVVQARLIFQRGPDGKVDGVQLQQNGHEIEAKRLAP